MNLEACLADVRREIPGRKCAAFADKCSIGTPRQPLLNVHEIPTALATAMLPKDRPALGRLGAVGLVVLGRPVRLLQEEDSDRVAAAVSMGVKVTFVPGKANSTEKPLVRPTVCGLLEEHWDRSLALGKLFSTPEDLRAVTNIDLERRATIQLRVEAAADNHATAMREVALAIAAEKPTDLLPRH